MARAAFYIDGFNLYHALDALGRPHLKWLNHWAVAKSYLSPADHLVSVSFYTAILTWERGKQERHKQYIAALEAAGCRVVRSRFARVNKHCRVMNRYCARHEEKQTDVSIATDLIADGVEDRYDVAYLITADSDQVPTIKTFLRLFPGKRIILCAPPRVSEGSRELGALVHDRKPLTEGRLERCIFPDAVADATGQIVARVPSSYRQGPGRII